MSASLARIALAPAACAPAARPSSRRLVRARGDLGGNYGDTFNDVDTVLMNYFTYRALKETLAQMQETDLSPGKGEYKWLYTFASKEFQNRGDEFVKKLFAEGRSDHAQRILAQRVVLMRRWRSYFNRGLGGERAQTKFEAVNLEILRGQLFCSLNASADEAECDEAELYNKILRDSDTEDVDV